MQYKRHHFCVSMHGYVVSESNDIIRRAAMLEFFAMPFIGLELRHNPLVREHGSTSSLVRVSSQVTTSTELN